MAVFARPRRCPWAEPVGGSDGVCRGRPWAGAGRAGRGRFARHGGAGEGAVPYVPAAAAGVGRAQFATAEAGPLLTGSIFAADSGLREQNYNDHSREATPVGRTKLPYPCQIWPHLGLPPFVSTACNFCVIGSSTTALTVRVHPEAVGSIRWVERLFVSPGVIDRVVDHHSGSPHR